MCFYILNKLYRFLNEVSIEHDLMNISQSELHEHDHAYFREKTDHKTHPKFKYYTEPQRVLSNIFHDRVVTENRWFYEAFYPEVLNCER